MSFSGDSQPGGQIEWNLHLTDVLPDVELHRCSLRLALDVVLHFGGLVHVARARSARLDRCPFGVEEANGVNAVHERSWKRQRELGRVIARFYGLQRDRGVTLFTRTPLI